MPRAHFLVIEANYDADMLLHGPYPPYLKARIAGPTGHMDNADTADYGIPNTPLRGSLTVTKNGNGTPVNGATFELQRLDDGNGEDGEYVVNSGIAKVFGEYDANGQLIQQFAYECQMQTYRAFKEDMAGFWFAE